MAGRALFSIVVVVATVAVVVGHAVPSPIQVYWETVLPNTPFLEFILSKFQPGPKPVIVNEQPGGMSAFRYRYAASADQLHDDPNVALFFLEKDLHQGTKFNMFFPNSKSGPKFLPRNVVDAIPFSSAKIPETLKHFSIEPNSQDAKTMVKTIKECEEPAVKGETKYCATSLESMVDFAKCKLGTNIKALATETKKEAPEQLYTIAPGVLHKMAGPKSVAWHIEAYVHAVYYCHETSDTTAYLLPLVGKDKVKVDAVAVCHKDTSQWNPKHIAFLKLKVKYVSVISSLTII